MTTRAFLRSCLYGPLLIAVFSVVLVLALWVVVLDAASKGFLAVANGLFLCVEWLCSLAEQLDPERGAKQ